MRAHSSFARLAPRSSLGFPSSAHSGRERSFISAAGPHPHRRPFAGQAASGKLMAPRAGCSEFVGTLLVCPRWLVSVFSQERLQSTSWRSTWLAIARRQAGR